jgi:hypothetical protein
VPENHAPTARLVNVYVVDVAVDHGFPYLVERAGAYGRLDDALVAAAGLEAHGLRIVDVHTGEAFLALTPAA